LQYRIVKFEVEIQVWVKASVTFGSKVGIQVSHPSEMSVLEVSIKLGGKTQNVSLDTSKPPSTFKQTIYEATGVPVDRMKVMSKGVVLKVSSVFLWQEPVLTSLKRTILPGPSLP
jgi:hypothetical protein